MSTHGWTARNKSAIRLQRQWRMVKERKKYLQLVKMSRYRTKIAEEILTTEKAYVHQLDLVVQVLLHPLRAAASNGKPIISDSEIRTIFSTIEIIVATNTEFLSKLRKRVEESWSPTQLLGDVFITMAGVFKLYTEYVQNFNESLRQIQECKKSSTFVTFCEKGFQNFPMEVNDLPSLLITPIQRIPRYELLLRDLLKHTWEDHKDYNNIKAALEQITDTAKFVNNKKNEAENIAKCMSIQNTLYGKNLESLVDPHRKFVREGALKEIGDKGKAKQRWYFLFTDILVCCAMSRSTAKKNSTKRDFVQSLAQQKLFKYLGKLELERCSVVNLGDEDQKKFGFEIVTSRDTLWLCASTQEEKDAWMKDLVDSIRAVKDKSDAREEQLDKIARQRASLTQAVLGEKYAGLKVHGATYGSLTRDTTHMSLTEKHQLQAEAEERIKQLKSEELELKKLANERADEFKSHVVAARMSVSYDSVPPEVPQQGNGSDAGDGKQRKWRERAGMRGSMHRSDSSGPTSPRGSSATASPRGSTSIPASSPRGSTTIPVSPRGSTSIPASSPRGSTSIPASGTDPTRPRSSTHIPTTTDEAASSPSTPADPSQPKLRRFASLKKERVESKHNTMTIPPSSSGGASAMRGSVSGEVATVTDNSAAGRNRSQSEAVLGSAVPAPNAGVAAAAAAGSPQPKLRKFAAMRKDRTAEKGA